MDGFWVRCGLERVSMRLKMDARNKLTDWKGSVILKVFARCKSCKSQNVKDLQN